MKWRIKALHNIFAVSVLTLQTKDLLFEYADEKVKLVFAEYKEVFESVPFQDKRR